MIEPGSPFWSQEAGAVLAALDASGAGLGVAEAQRRYIEFGPNRLEERRKSEGLRLLLAQFKNPVILILLAAATLSIFLHDRADARYCEIAANRLRQPHYPFSCMTARMR